MDPVTISALISAAASLGSAGIDAYSRSGSGNSQLNTGRPNQIALQDSLIDRIQQRLNGQGGLSAMSQNAINRFNSQTVPSLAERFTALGSGGSQGSSAFAGQLGKAGAGLQQNLEEMDFNQILQLLGHALGQSSENIQTEPSNFFSNALSGIDKDTLTNLAKAFGSNGANQTTNTSGNGILGNIGDYTKNLHAQNYGNFNPYFGNRLGGNPFSVGI